MPADVGANSAGRSRWPSTTSVTAALRRQISRTWPKLACSSSHDRNTKGRPPPSATLADHSSACGTPESTRNIRSRGPLQADVVSSSTADEMATTRLSSRASSANLLTAARTNSSRVAGAPMPPCNACGASGGTRARVLACSPSMRIVEWGPSDRSARRSRSDNDLGGVTFVPVTFAIIA